MSQHLFKVSTLCPHTSTKTATPLISCTVNDGLVHAIPNVHHTLLEFINVVQCAPNIVCCIQRIFNVNQKLKQ